MTGRAVLCRVGLQEDRAEWRESQRQRVHPAEAGDVRQLDCLKEDFMATAPTLLATLQQRLSYRTRERWFRRVVERRKPERPLGFFDDYSGFLTGSQTAATANRLNERHRAMIESNRDIIFGRGKIDDRQAHSPRSRRA